MQLSDILTLVGGLALFLLGMNSMGDGLEQACGNKMKSILKKLTSNRFIGVFVGMVITAIIQSSSATTVMVVGFVNAGMMSLTQAIWIIMGANIGTTVTGLLIALDVGLIAPAVALIGVVFMLFIKKPFINEIGKILAGFGVLFIGMDMMSGAMMPLRESEAFVGLMTQFSNPILGILVGIVFTAVIQSSSASVGILQALAISGAIQLDSAVFILFGQNIGTCVTALLASIGTNRAAKRTTLIHFIFNLIGTVLFTIICLVTPLVDFMKEKFTSPAMQIANMHTIFNIATTLLLLPFGQYLAKLATIILPEKKEETESIFMYLDNNVRLRIGNQSLQMGNLSLHLENVKREVKRMYAIACENIDLAFQDITSKSNDNRKKILENEELIDKLNDGIIKHISSNLSNDLNYSTSVAYEAYLTIANNTERLSDHAKNLSDENETVINNNLKLSSYAHQEIIKIKNILKDMQNGALEKDKIEDIKEYENRIDELTERYRNNMMTRLREAVCTGEGSISYSTFLINFERIGDHLLNISEQIEKML